MRAEQDRLLDVGGARRAGDQVDRARHVALAIGGADLSPHLFVVAGDVLRGDDDDMVVGQEVERGRIVRRPTPASACRFRRRPAKAWLTATEVPPDGRPCVTSSAVPLPWHPSSRGSSPMRDAGRQIVAAQISRDRGRHVGGRRRPRRPSPAPSSAIVANSAIRAVAGQLAARRNDALRRTVAGARPRPRGAAFAAVDAERAADRCRGCRRARGHRCRALRSVHIA